MTNQKTKAVVLANRSLTESKLAEEVCSSTDEESAQGKLSGRLPATS